MAHVFVSYMHKDEPKLRPLFSALRRAGVDAWIDRDELVGGSFWRADIRRSIESGAHFLCCFSQTRQQTSKTVAHEETLIALDRLRSTQYGARWFIPVRVDKCEIPDIPIFGNETLRSLQWIDLFVGMDAGIRQVLESLGVDPKTIGRVCDTRPRSGTAKEVAHVQLAYHRWLSNQFSEQTDHAAMVLENCLEFCRVANSPQRLDSSSQKHWLSDTKRVLDAFVEAVRATLAFYSPYMTGPQFFKASSALEALTSVDRCWRYVTTSGERFSGDHDEESLLSIKRLIAEVASTLASIGDESFRVAEVHGRLGRKAREGSPPTRAEAPGNSDA